VVTVNSPNCCIFLDLTLQILSHELHESFEGLDVGQGGYPRMQFEEPVEGW
jgi:hypothetical protein